MRILMYCGAVLSGLLGVIIFAGAKGAIHEIEAGICFLIAAVLLAGGATRGGLQRIAGRLDTLVEVRAQERVAQVVEEPALEVEPENIPEPQPSGWVEQAKAEIRKDRAVQEGV